MQTPSPIEPDRQQSSCRPRNGRFLSDERGETALEYGLIASLVILALLTTLTQLGNASTTMYSKISNAVSNSGH